MGSSLTVLGTVGVDKPLQQTAINACLTLWNLGFAVLGAALSDRAGRRKLWLTSSGGLLVCFVCLITLSGLFAERNNTNAGLASVAFIFLAFAVSTSTSTHQRGTLTLASSTRLLGHRSAIRTPRRFYRTPVSLSSSSRQTSKLTAVRASGFALFSFLGYAGIIFGQW